MNESVEHVESLIELHVHLEFSHFLGFMAPLKIQRWCPSFSTSESSDVAAAMATPSTLQSHCKVGFLDRCGGRDQIFMLVCVMHGLLDNAWIDPVDRDVDEAGMRLRSRVTCWSGKTCTAKSDSVHRRVFDWTDETAVVVSVETPIGP